MTLLLVSPYITAIVFVVIAFKRTSTSLKKMKVEPFEEPESVINYRCIIYLNIAVN